MRKIFLGIFLLAALATIGYLKTDRDLERKAEVFIEEHSVGARTTDLGQADIDSLEHQLELAQTALIESEMALCDSLEIRSQLQANLTDSLANQIESQRSEITRLKKQIATRESTTTARQAKAMTTRGKASHTSILHHYKLAVAKLPTDLSAYEMQVAVAEVRTETAARFDITIVRLNQIRDRYKIDY